MKWMVFETTHVEKSMKTKWHSHYPSKRLFQVTDHFWWAKVCLQNLSKLPPPAPRWNLLPSTFVRTEAPPTKNCSPQSHRTHWLPEDHLADFHGCAAAAAAARFVKSLGKRFGRYDPWIDTFSQATLQKGQIVVAFTSNYLQKPPTGLTNLDKMCWNHRGKNPKTCS